MISIKSRKEVDMMRRAGDILARCFIAVAPAISTGAKTGDLDRIANEFIRANNAIPSFYGVKGFFEDAPAYPASVCVSVNDEVIHGIPGSRQFREGDVVSVDMGVYFEGYHSDMARTFIVGKASERALELVKAAEGSYLAGMKGAVAGMRVSDISRLIQAHAEGAGFSVVRDFVGHGIGVLMHEPPQVPNFVDKRSRRGERLLCGMALAVEPMINAGACEVAYLSDRWTVVTKDGSLSAHYENTVLVTDGEPLVLSAAG
jgi:methionyl aminopeptidase